VARHQADNRLVGVEGNRAACQQQRPPDQRDGQDGRSAGAGESARSWDERQRVGDARHLGMDVRPGDIGALAATVIVVLPSLTAR